MATTTKSDGGPATSALGAMVTMEVANEDHD